MDDQIHWLHDIISTYLPKIILAIGTLVIGWIVIGWVTRFFGRTLKRSHLEPSVSHYFRSLVSIFLKVLLIFSVASTFGIVTTSLDRKSTRLNSSHVAISYAVFCLITKSSNSRVGPM